MPAELRDEMSDAFSTESAAAARERLIAFLEWLEGTSNVKEADAIRGFLSGRFESLDAAFGLVAPSRPRGAPPDLDRKLDLAREIEGLKQQGKKWSEILDALSEKNSVGSTLDERSLRRIYREFQDLRRRVWSSGVMTAEIAGAALDLVGTPNESPSAAGTIPKRKYAAPHANQPGPKAKVKPAGRRDRLDSNSRD